MSEEATTVNWTQAASLALRLALVDPDTKLGKEARLTIEGIVAETPDGIYDDLHPDLVEVAEIVAFVELMDQFAK